MSAYLDQLYFDWLCNQVYSVKTSSPSRSYRNLFHILYTTEFVWLVPNDDNRIEDGKDLRREFLEDENIRVDGWDHEWINLGCSMLELLLGLSRRLSFETDESENFWLFELLENIDLKQYNDRTPISLDDIIEILDRVIFRTYLPNGHGGLFPLKHPQCDQRDLELWYQLSAYILER